MTNQNKYNGKQSAIGKLVAFAAICAAMASSPLFGDAVKWDGGGNGSSLSDRANWVGDVAPVAGDALDFSAITAATTLNADFEGESAFGAVTMGTGVITFTGKLTASSFNDYTKVAVGADATVTITEALTFTGAGPKLCNSIGAGGKLWLKELLTIRHASGEFSFEQTPGGGAVVAEGGIAVDAEMWVMMNVRSLVLGEAGIAFTKETFFIVSNDSTVYSLGANTVLGTGGVNAAFRTSGTNSTSKFNICTTQFGTDQPATITLTGKISAGKNGTNKYYGSAAVTGCGKVVFTSTSSSNRGLTVNSGATLSMTPGVNTAAATDQTFAVNSGATLEIADAGTVEIGGLLTFASDSTLNIVSCTLGTAALSVAKTLTLPSSGTVNLMLNGGAFAPGVYVVIENSGVTAAMGDKFNVSADGQSVSWSVVGNKLVLKVGDVPDNCWTGVAGDRSMSNGNNWAGGVAPAEGSALDFSAVTAETELNADFDDNRTFGAVTMGTGVITFTGSLTASSFTDYTKVAVGEGATVTITDALTFDKENLYLCNSVAGTLHLEKPLTIGQLTNKDASFDFAKTDSGGAVIAEGGVVVRATNWVVMNAKSLVLGEKGIDFTKASLFIMKNASTMYSLGASTVLGTADVNAKYVGNNQMTFTICTTRFKSDQPATITVTGKIGGVKPHWGGAAVTGCGRIEFADGSATDRSIAVGEEATIVMNPGNANLGANDQSFSIGAGSTLEIPASGTVSLKFKTTTITSGATLSFNFTERNVAPVLATSGSAAVNATVNVKVTASEDVMPRSGDFVLTSGFNFTGKTVNLVDPPKWVKGVSVDGNGNLVLSVKPKGFVILFR